MFRAKRDELVRALERQIGKQVSEDVLAAIDEERLAILPFATQCVDCKRRKEAGKKFLEGTGRGFRSGFRDVREGPGEEEEEVRKQGQILFSASWLPGLGATDPGRGKLRSVPFSHSLRIEHPHLAGGDFPKGGDDVFVFAFDQGPSSLEELFGALRSSQDELEAIRHLLQTIFNGDSRHA